VILYDSVQVTGIATIEADQVLQAMRAGLGNAVKKQNSNPTITDVAQAAGVAIMTVSRVVNGGSYVSAETEKRVRVAIKKLGYRPNQAARMLKGQRAMMIGLIIPDLSDSFFGTVANAVQQVAGERGYMTLVVASTRNAKFEADEIEMMAGHSIAGLLIVPSRTNYEPLQQLVSAGVPIVAIDRPLPGITADEVTVDNYGGAQAAVRHLIEHGHKRIVCMGYDHDVLSIKQRVLGYSNAMQAAGLKREIYDKTPTVESVISLVQRWTKHADPPTAVFSLNNVSTVNALRAFQHLEMQVPQKMALAGFDDFELASLLASPVTTVRQPAVEMGLRAAKQLFERIMPQVVPTMHTGMKVVLPVELIVRESCGCPAHKSARHRS
jgi:LacI family transcriptional regulator